jgi:hypothetical protein
MLNITDSSPVKYALLNNNIVAPNANHVFCFVGTLDTSQYSNIFGAGLASSANSLNFGVSAGIINCFYFGGQNLSPTASSYTVPTNTPVVIAVQIRSAVLEIWAGKVGEPILLRSSTAAASMGAVTFNAQPMIFSRADFNTARNLVGACHQFFYLSGTAFNEDAFNAISNGADIRSFAFIAANAANLYYRFDVESGNASNSVDLLNSNHAVIKNGPIANMANPVYQNWLIAKDFGASNGNGYTMEFANQTLFNWDIKVSSSSTSADSRGLWNFTMDNVIVEGVNIEMQCPACYGFRHGEFGFTGPAGGYYKDIKVKGPTFPSNTPHCFVLSQQTNATARQGYLRGLHVGILAALTTNCDVQGFICDTQNGQSIYLKAVTNAVIKNCMILHDGSITNVTALISAVWAANISAVNIDCTTGTVDNIDVWVKDLTKITALGYIGPLAGNAALPQPVAFTNIRWHLPIEQYNPSTNYFNYLGVIGGAANYTFAQWSAISANGASTAGGSVILHPQARIQREIDNIRNMYGTNNTGIVKNLLTQVINK